MAEAISLNRVVRAYNAIRDARTQAKRAWEQQDLELETDQQKLKVLMLSMLNANGAKSIATESGTIYRTEKVRAGAADWSAVWEWAKQNDAMDIFERRVKTAFVKEFMDEHGGLPPPGINVHREFEVNVRRANESS